MQPNDSQSNHQNDVASTGSAATEPATDEVILTPMHPHGREIRLPKLGRHAASQLAIQVKRAYPHDLIEIASNGLRWPV